LALYYIKNHPARLLGRFREKTLEVRFYIINEAYSVVLEKLSEAKKLGLCRRQSFEPREQWWLWPLEPENTRFGKTIW